MKSFVKAAEIWQTGPEGDRLHLSTSYYGDLIEFAEASKDMGFAYGEGLPGQTWAQARPLVWTDLQTDAFLRSESAKRAGIACGLSIPIFAGDFLLAVLVLFFADDEDVTGAVEVWGNRGSETELKLVEGYYGVLERFEWVSRRLTIMRGRGLPGGAWGDGKPLIISDLGQSSAFLRARNAAESGITTGVAVPFSYGVSDTQVLTFLSARGTPIARRFEVWVPDTEGKRLVFETGHTEAGEDLHSIYRDVSFAKGHGTRGLAWLTGRPSISSPAEGADDGPLVLLPVIDDCRLVAVVGLVL